MPSMRPLYGRCPYLGGSVMGGSTIYSTGNRAGHAAYREFSTVYNFALNKYLEYKVGGSE